MKGSTRKSPGRRSRLILPHEDIQPLPCLPIWWDESDSLLKAGIGDAAQPVPSLRHLERLCEQASTVAVPGLSDQATARCDVGDVCPPEKIRIVYGLAPYPLSSADAASRGPYLVRRRYFHEYDYPLNRLQMAAGSPNSDLVACFQATLQGAFHEFWDIPLTSQAAELWATVGDIFSWTLRTHIDFIDFSCDIPNRTITAIHGPQRELSEIEEVILNCLAAVKSKRGPAPACRIRSLARDIMQRRAVRRLFPVAWSGTLAVDEELRRRAASLSPDSMSDPRRWIWRAPLRASSEEVSLAYLEACLGWVLAQLQHPELFPPANPLFDASARQYFTETGFPSGIRADSHPLNTSEA